MAASSSAETPPPLGRARSQSRIVRVSVGDRALDVTQERALNNSKTNYVTWRFNSPTGEVDDDNQVVQHFVELTHDKIWGRRLISVDGTQVYKKRFKLIDGGSRHRFTYNRVAYMIVIAERNMQFVYELFINGAKVEDLRVAERPALPEHSIMGSDDDSDDEISVIGGGASRDRDDDDEDADLAALAAAKRRKEKMEKAERKRKKAAAKAKAKAEKAAAKAEAKARRKAARAKARADAALGKDSDDSSSEESDSDEENGGGNGKAFEGPRFFRRELQVSYMSPSAKAQQKKKELEQKESGGAAADVKPTMLNVSERRIKLGVATNYVCWEVDLRGVDGQADAKPSSEAATQSSAAAPSGSAAAPAVAADSAEDADAVAAAKAAEAAAVPSADGAGKGGDGDLRPKPRAGVRVIECWHDTVFGKRLIKIDGEKVYKKKFKLFDGGSSHKVIYKGMEYTVRIHEELQFIYTLYVNHQPAMDARERRQLERIQRGRSSSRLFNVSDDLGDSQQRRLLKRKQEEEAEEEAKRRRSVATAATRPSRARSQSRIRTVSIGGEQVNVTQSEGKASKTTNFVSWEVEVDKGKKKYHVELWHGTVFGTRTIHINSVEVVHKTKFKFSSANSFTHDGVVFTVHVRMKLGRFTYDLEVNGERVKDPPRLAAEATPVIVENNSVVFTGGNVELSTKEFIRLQKRRTSLVAPAGWETHFTEEGIPFWYCPSTGASVWEKPTEAAPVAVKDQTVAEEDEQQAKE